MIQIKKNDSFVIISPSKLNKQSNTEGQRPICLNGPAEPLPHRSICDKFLAISDRQNSICA